MAETFSVTEVSRITGLAPHTLRYYEQQFPILLDVERSRGGHRIYRQRHLELFKAIIQLLKKEKVSIKEARRVLGEPENGALCKDSGSDEEKINDSVDIGKMLMIVIEKLDWICRNSDNRDRMIMSYFKAQNEGKNDDLINQISRCRKETHETVKLCQTIIRQGFGMN